MKPFLPQHSQLCLLADDMVQCLHVGQNVAAIGVKTFQHYRNNFEFFKMGFVNALVGN